MNESTLHTPTRLSPRASVLLICAAILLVLLDLALYTLLHEGGHALLGLLFGGSITSFSANFFDLSAHVGIDGPFAVWQRALISAAGVSLPLLSALVLAFLTPRRNNLLLDGFRLSFFICSVSALLAWIFIPLLVMSGQAVGDDSANFLNITGIPPLLETAAALLVFALSWVIFLLRTGNPRDYINRLRTPALDLHHPGTQRTLRTLAALGILIITASLALTLGIPDRTLEAPSGYTLVTQLDLSKQAYSDQSVYSFHLDQPGQIALFITLENVNGAPSRVRMIGPGGYDTTFFAESNPQAKIGRATVQPCTDDLTPGDYALRVTLPQGPGKVKIYVREP